MIIKSRNITGSSLLIIEEECKYSPCNSNPQSSTRYSQSAKIQAYLPLFSGKFEQYSFQSMKNKSNIGLNTIDNLCNQIKTNGVISLLENLITKNNNNNNSNNNNNNNNTNSE